MMPAYFGFHLTSFSICWASHWSHIVCFTHQQRSCLFFLSGLLHVLIQAANKASLNIGESKQMFRLIVSNVVSNKNDSVDFYSSQLSAWRCCSFCRCLYFICRCLKSSFVAIRLWPLSWLTLLGDKYFLTRSILAFTYSTPAAPLRPRSFWSPLSAVRRGRSRALNARQN